MKDAIGGYFELELLKRFETLYPDLIHLNTGRNAFEYILRVRKYKKVFIPYFTCDVLLEPIRKLQIGYEFYDINNQLEAIFDFEKLTASEGVLITNYFGVKTEYIKRLSASVRNLIVDNAQALFCEPELKIDTFYSLRKFVGIPDGGLLSINTRLEEELELDTSHERFLHLIKRLDCSAEDGYLNFKENDARLSNLSIRQMSNLTKRILQSIDFNDVKAKRRENFHFLHKALKDINELKIELKATDAPMVYPLKIRNADSLKQKLISNRIYAATYWPNVLEWCTENQNAYILTKRIVSLPIDQRYGREDLINIIEITKNSI